MAKRAGATLRERREFGESSSTGPRRRLRRAGATSRCRASCRPPPAPAPSGSRHAPRPGGRPRPGAPAQTRTEAHAPSPTGKRSASERARARGLAPSLPPRPLRPGLWSRPSRDRAHSRSVVWYQSGGADPGPEGSSDRQPYAGRVPREVELARKNARLRRLPGCGASVPTDRPEARSRHHRWPRRFSRRRRRFGTGSKRRGRGPSARRRRTHGSGPAAFWSPLQEAPDHPQAEGLSGPFEAADAASGRGGATPLDAAQKKARARPNAQLLEDFKTGSVSGRTPRRSSARGTDSRRPPVTSCGLARASSGSFRVPIGGRALRHGGRDTILRSAGRDSGVSPRGRFWSRSGSASTRIVPASARGRWARCTGPRPGAQALRRDQGHLRQPRQRRAVPPPLPAGGTVGRPAQPSEHHDGLRVQRGARPGLPGHGVPRRHRPAGSHRPAQLCSGSRTSSASSSRSATGWPTRTRRGSSIAT